MSVYPLQVIRPIDGSVTSTNRVTWIHGKTHVLTYVITRTDNSKDAKSVVVLLQLYTMKTCYVTLKCET